MQRRYPKVYGANKQNLGYKGSIRWNPASSLPQPKPPEPPSDSGVVLWLNASKPRLAPSQTKTNKETPTKKPNQKRAVAKKRKQAQQPTKRAPTPKPTRSRTPARKRAKSQKQRNRLEQKRAKRRLARATRRKSRPRTRVDQKAHSGYATRNNSML